MTKEEIQKRVSEIEQAIHQCLANYNVLQGRLEESKQWLANITTAVDPVAPVEDVKPVE